MVALLVALASAWLGSWPCLASIVAALVGLILLYSGFAIRLVVTEEGIEYQQVGYSVRTAWHKVLRIGPARMGLVPSEALILADYSIRGAKWLSLISGMRPKGAIPLSSFDLNWRTSEIGRAIRQYAPKLFEGEAELGHTSVTGDAG